MSTLTGVVAEVLAAVLLALLRPPRIDLEALREGAGERDRFG